MAAPPLEEQLAAQRATQRQIERQQDEVRAEGRGLDGFGDWRRMARYEEKRCSSPAATAPLAPRIRPGRTSVSLMITDAMVKLGPGVITSITTHTASMPSVGRMVR